MKRDTNIRVEVISFYSFLVYIFSVISSSISFFMFGSDKREAKKKGFSKKGQKKDSKSIWQATHTSKYARNSIRDRGFK